jgi:peptidoglycan hydrolase CwlO-like protein
MYGTHNSTEKHYNMTRYKMYVSSCEECGNNFIESEMLADRYHGEYVEHDEAERLLDELREEIKELESKIERLEEKVEEEYSRGYDAGLADAVIVHNP